MVTVFAFFQNKNSAKIKSIATEQKRNLDDFDVRINFDDFRLFKLTEQILKTDSINLLLLVNPVILKFLASM